jgi:Tfp pilus assembly protein PilF
VLNEKAERTVDGDGKVAIYLQVANLYLERFSNQAEAIKAFEKVLELDPNNLQAPSTCSRSTRSAATGRS